MPVMEPYLPREKQFLDAIKAAQAVLPQYVHPGPRDCEATINRLMAILDDGDLVQAVHEADDPSRDRG